MTKDEWKKGLGEFLKMMLEISKAEARKGNGKKGGSKCLKRR